MKEERFVIQQTLKNKNKKKESVDQHEWRQDKFQISGE
jgi:hypothetical protein